MKEFKCSVAQKGFFAGPVFFISPPAENKAAAASDAESELRKLHHAADSLKQSITEKRLTGKSAEIQETVLSILSDDKFTGLIEHNISSLSLNAPAAVKKAAQELAEALNDVDSEYIRSRQDDIHGVADQLLTILSGTGCVPEECSAICASEISPAQLSAIEDRLIGGMLSDKGSPNSHTSILAGNIGIPYLYGNSGAVEEARKAGFIILDSETGTVITDPDDDMKNTALTRMEQVARQRMITEDAQDSSLTQTKTKIYANIESPQDISELLESGADGVGLFRTEFLFLDSSSIPTEEEQYTAYSSVLEAMAEKEVIIRTMDIGSDKKAPWLELPEESNPALGMRGVRVSLERKELFNTQLRALLRAAVNGNLKIMFPMIVSPWEIDEAKDRIREVAEQLRSEGKEYRIPPVGIMVETPAAAVCAEELAGKADFFSIGTNDLTQYTIALDREAQGLDRYFAPYHEAVFKLVAMTADGGRRHGIETGVCGQLASDSNAVKRLIASGVNELSVSMRKVKSTRIIAAEAEKQLLEEAMQEKQDALPSVSAPADGKLIPMADIPDPVFAGGSLGECFGILPENGSVYAPVAGTVIDIAQTGHAMTVRADEGMEILVHVGINTVNLGSKAFTHHVGIGEHIEKDQLIMEADLDMIRSAGLSTIIVTALLSCAGNN